MCKHKIYLDSCCHNRPFDNQHGIKAKDALHIACAIKCDFDYRITTDTAKS